MEVLCWLAQIPPSKPPPHKRFLKFLCRIFVPSSSPTTHTQKLLSILFPTPEITNLLPVSMGSSYKQNQAIHDLLYLKIFHLEYWLQVSSMSQYLWVLYFLLWFKNISLYRQITSQYISLAHSSSSITTRIHFILDWIWGDFPK